MIFMLYKFQRFVFVQTSSSVFLPPILGVGRLTLSSERGLPIMERFFMNMTCCIKTVDNTP